MYLIDEELVKKLMIITIDRLEQDSISKEELEYLERIIDLINQMFKKSN